MKQVYIFFALLFSLISYSQVGIGTTSPNPSAILDLTASNKALLIPRLASIDSISIPVNGMMIYDISASCIKSYENNSWTSCLSGLNDFTFAKIVYVNASTPSNATIFDLVIPPITNDVSLVQQSNNLYIANNGQAFTWNGTSYVSYLAPPQSPFYLQGSLVDAGSNKTGKIWRQNGLLLGDGVLQTDNFSGYFLAKGNMISNPTIFAFENTVHANTGMFLGNGGGVNFLPILTMRPSGSFRSIFIGVANVDSGSEPALQFRAQVPNIGPVVNRPTFTWQNGGVGGFEQMRLSANGRLGVGNPNPQERVDIAGAIKISNGGYSDLFDGATTPLPSGGAGTIVFVNGSFFGFNGATWKKLDN